MEPNAIISPNKILKLIDENKGVNITNFVCDISNIFEDIEILPSDGGSGTVQFIAKIKDKHAADVLTAVYNKKNKVFVKVSTDHIPTDGVEIERDIYRLLAYTLDNYISPNFVQFVASFRCDNPRDFVKDSQWAAASMLSTLNADSGDKINFLVLEAQKVVYFFDDVPEDDDMSLMNLKLTKDDIISVLFQITYALHILNLFHIRHNDLHTKNILIDVGEKEEKAFFIKKNVYYLTPKSVYTPKIFDFDQSTYTIGDHRNTDSQGYSCEKYGMCATPNAKFDIFTLCYYIKNVLLETHPSYTLLEEYIDFVVKDEKLFNPDVCCKGFASRLCKYDEKYNRCEDWEPSDDQVLSPIQVLKQFPHFKKLQKEVDSSIFNDKCVLPGKNNNTPRDYEGKQLFVLPNKDDISASQIAKCLYDAHISL